MGQDYYKILGLTRSASDADIKKAYRKLSLQYHPDKNHGDQVAYEKFKKVAEAYDVLSDARKRATFEQFGEEGLKNGVPHGVNEAGAWTEGYTFHGDPEEVFRQFFGGDNPFSEFTRQDGDLSLSFGGINGRGRLQRDPPIERDLALSLEEIYHGCVKKMKISRRVMNPDGHTSSIREKILAITVKKGWYPGTKIVFPEEGDQGPNAVPADIVFILKDKDHARFRREGVDLIHKTNISLEKALTGCNIDIPTLDERILTIPINNIVHPTYQKIVPGEGMPLSSDPTKKGDLIIEFNVEFPRKLNSSQKEHLRKALRQ